MDDLFYQVIFSSRSYFTTGRYFRTMDEGLEYLKEDAKKRENSMHPAMARLETRSFDPSYVNLIVAKQYNRNTMARKRIGVHILSVPEEAPR